MKTYRLKIKEKCLYYAEKGDKNTKLGLAIPELNCFRLVISLIL